MSILRRLGGKDGAEIERLIGNVAPHFLNEVEKVENKILSVVPQRLLPSKLRDPISSLTPKDRVSHDKDIYPIYNYYKHVKMIADRTFNKSIYKRIGEDDGVKLSDPLSDAIDRLLDPFLSKMVINLPPDASKALRNFNNVWEDPVNGSLKAIGDYMPEINSFINKRYGTENGVAELVGNVAGVDSNIIQEMADMADPRHLLHSPKVPKKIEWGKDQKFTVFEGRKSVEGIEVWNSSLWDIEMESYNYNGFGPPDPPYVNGTKFLPITSFEFMDSNLTPFSVELYGGSAIMIPESINFQKSLRINVLDTLKNGHREWKKYMSDYKSYMVNDYKVMQYKNCCTKITLHMFDTSTREIYRRSYLGILMTPDTSFSGSGFGNEEFSIEYSIVGELSEGQYVNIWRST